MEEEILEEEVEDMPEPEEEGEELAPPASPLEGTLKMLEDMVAQLRAGVEDGSITTEEEMADELMALAEGMRPEPALGGMGLEDPMMEGVPPVGMHEEF